ncbi:hypothetical protein IWX90DRAFT_504014 [Phyllosticta citrichinensis]|uniref:Uncharacterized protein n=1 Tax=Phyllosticta citrichinensis TaxID=1130410 RepID=A0ABR1XV78_9PEZI
MRPIFEEMLFVDESDVPKIHEADFESLEPEDSTKTNPPKEQYVPLAPLPELSRKRHRKAGCFFCGEEFEIRDNSFEACIRHKGDIEYDEEYWGRYCERGGGHITTKDNLEDHPEGFIWTCCNQPYDEKGCAIGKHVDDANEGRKRGRYALSTCQLDLFQIISSFLTQSERNVNEIPHILQQGIKSYRTRYLNNAIAQIYLEHPDTRDFIEKVFLIDEADIPESDSEGSKESDDEYTAPATSSASNAQAFGETGVKRKEYAPPPDLSTKRTRYAECGHCGLKFDALFNTKDQCAYYPGKLVPHMDYWDTLVSGYGMPRLPRPLLSDENIEEHPNGFAWDCCGDQEGDQASQDTLDCI